MGCLSKTLSLLNIKKRREQGKVERKGPHAHAALERYG